jgi:glycosyltransferase involved in cell wall biosynthesis
VPAWPEPYDARWHERLVTRPSERDIGAGRPVVAIYRTQILPLSETFVRDQALALRRWQPILVGEREIDGLPLAGLAVAARHSGPPRFLQRLAGVFWRSLDQTSPGLIKLVQQWQVRLIHAHFGFDGVEAWPIARRLGLPLLVTLHGSDITTRMQWFSEGRAGRRWRSYPHRLARLAVQKNVSFVAVSKNIREAAIVAGLPESRIFVHPIGINTQNFTRSGLPVSQRRPIILFLGRLVEKKGASYLLEAFEVLRQNLPEAELVIAGDGPKRQELAARAEAIGGVRFVGAFSREQAQALLAEARVLCLPSITAESGDAEGLPLVILEAQACGVPVVTSARGGTDEGILDGETGYAFAERDVPTMIDRLSRLLTDAVLAEKFSAASPGFVAATHNLHSRTAELENLYDQVSGCKT